MVFIDMATSLDGFVSDPNGGDGGLHDWYFSPTPASQGVIDGLMTSIGAMVMGKRAFGGDEKAVEEGFDTPYKVPHFVLTHKTLPSVERDGASFHFMSGDLKSVLRRAKEAAGTRDVCIAGGADTARQFLQGELVDELHLHLVPKLFGSGLRLLEGVSADLERLGIVEGEGVTHLRFRVKGRPDGE